MPPVTLIGALLGSALGLTLLGGCADMRDQVSDMVGSNDKGPRTVAYRCDDDRDFKARFSGDRDRVVIDTGGKSYDLDYAGRDNGRRVYGKERDVYLAADEDNAYLRIPGESDFKDCERRS
jgi:hypothetical protein